MRRRKACAQLTHQLQRHGQAIPVARVVEPAALTRRVRQRNHHRPLAEAMADAILEATGPEKARDRELPDEDQNPGSEDAKLGVEPVRAVGDSRRRWLEVAISGAIAAGKAAHERGDVSEVPEVFWAREPCSHHPPVELLAGAPRERPARLPLDRAGRLADQKEGRAPMTRKRGSGLGDYALVDTDVARAALGLKGKQRRATRHGVKWCAPESR